jgi:hypothetical protein
MEELLMVYWFGGQGTWDIAGLARAKIFGKISFQYGDLPVSDHVKVSLVWHHQKT